MSMSQRYANFQVTSHIIHHGAERLCSFYRREIPNTYHIVVLGTGGVGKSCLTGIHSTFLDDPRFIE